MRRAEAGGAGGDNPLRRAAASGHGGPRPGRMPEVKVSLLQDLEVLRKLEVLRGADSGSRNRDVPDHAKGAGCSLVELERLGGLASHIGIVLALNGQHHTPR